MAIVGGLDIHRKQITFDYLDTATGELQRGQIAPADRAHLAAWLARRFPGGQDFRLRAGGVHRVAVCRRGTGGGRDHSPSWRACRDGSGARPEKRAKTDRADSRHMRELLADGRLPECWIPPSHILDCRALLGRRDRNHRVTDGPTARALPGLLHPVMSHQPGATRPSRPIALILSPAVRDRWRRMND